MKPILYPKHSQSGFDNWSTLRSYVHLLLLAYAWFWTCVRWHLTLVFSVLFFKSFQNFFWNIFLGLRRGFSFESNFNISFCRISNLSFYLVRTGFGKVVRKITRWKVWCVTCTFWYFPTYFKYANILAHVRQFYGNCRTLSMGKVCSKFKKRLLNNFCDIIPLPFFVYSKLFQLFKKSNIFLPPWKLDVNWTSYVRLG